MKPVENRPSVLSYRGPVAIHAGRTWDRGGAHDPRVLSAFAPYLTPLQGARRGIDPAEHRDLFPLGAVIAVVDLVGAHYALGGCCAPWGEPPPLGQRVAHLQVANARMLPEPVPCRGALGLWTLPDYAARDVEVGLTRAELSYPADTVTHITPKKGTP